MRVVGVAEPLMAALRGRVAQAVAEMVEILVHLRVKTGMLILAVVLAEAVKVRDQTVTAALAAPALSSSSTQSHRLLRLM
jgi:hypothetical protein